MVAFRLTKENALVLSDLLPQIGLNSEAWHIQMFCDLVDGGSVQDIPRFGAKDALPLVCPTSSDAADVRSIAGMS